MIGQRYVTRIVCAALISQLIVLLLMQVHYPFLNNSLKSLFFFLTKYFLADVNAKQILVSCQLKNYEAFSSIVYMVDERVVRKSPISKRLKEARILAKLSQKQLGIAIGIDQFVASPRMNQYETGKHTPGFNVVEKIAKVLKEPSCYFYTTEDELAELIKIYGSLTKKDQQRLIKYAKKLCE